MASSSGDKSLDENDENKLQIIESKEGEDALGPLRERELEARMECLKAKSINLEMFVSGFDVDDQGIEDAEDPSKFVPFFKILNKTFLRLGLTRI
jgi:hypothetical protein